MKKPPKPARRDSDTPADADDRARRPGGGLAPWLNGARPYVPPPSPPGLIYYSRKEGSPDDK